MGADSLYDDKPNYRVDHAGRLAEARREQGISLKEAARRTGISAHALEGLEKGDKASRPGAIYARALLGNYAEALGLEGHTLLRRWPKEPVGKTPPQHAPPPGESSPEAPTSDAPVTQAAPGEHLLAELTQDPDPAVPRPAKGIDLIGAYKGSGFKETPYLARRLDGQVVQLPRLLYLVAAAVDGQRDFGQIAERVSQEFGRHVTADNVQFLVEKKLRPLGVLAVAEGETIEPPPRVDEAFLGLRYRLGLIPASLVRSITTPFLFLFWPPVVVAVLCGLVAVDVWLFFHGVLQGAQEIIYQPALFALTFLGLEMFAMAWHECGHAAACRYGGAKPGVVGVGIYVIWFVFYSDVTDSYRLDKVGRLRTDFGGVYFDAIFTLLLAGAYFITGFEPLLVLVLFNQLDALDEFSPFLRLDGYYILSDLTGVPDLFKSIRPVLKSLIPGQEADEHVKSLKPWVRMVITMWVLAVVPVLLVGLVMLVIYGPWVIATAWDSFFVQYGEVSSALKDGRTVDIILGLLNIGALIVPVAGGILLFAWVSTRWSAVLWRLSKGRLIFRTGIAMLVLAAAAGSLFLTLLWLGADLLP